jgi:acetolactate synthase-1/2/3 large subunit
MSVTLPKGKIIIQVINDWIDFNKDYRVDYPILGDAKVVLKQLVQALRSSAGGKIGRDTSVTDEIEKVKGQWLKEWMPKLTSDEVPINPYRVIWEFMKAVNPGETIVTHDSGSPRDQIIPFYESTPPRGYIGWGKSHALGTGLGLIMGAKLAHPEKFCVNFMGDSAIGMTGMDFETAVRSEIAITTIVLKNSTMASEITTLTTSHERYKTRDLGGEYAELGKALGGYAERIEDPAEIAAAINRAKKFNVEGKTVLLEFITSVETAVSDPQPTEMF